MKISIAVLRKLLYATVLSAVWVSLTGQLALSQSKPSAVAKLQFEVGPVAKETLIDNKTEIKDTTRTGSMKLVIPDKTFVVLRKGAKLTFKGDSSIQLSPGSTLTLDVDSLVVLKSGARIDLATPCLIPAKQFFIVDPGKVLRSVGGAPAIYASQIRPFHSDWLIANGPPTTD